MEGDNCSHDSDDETISSLATAYQNVSRSNMLPMPEVVPSKMSREFELEEFSAGLEVTSLDMTSHGCSVLAGCSNGMIILFDMTNATK